MLLYAGRLIGQFAKRRLEGPIQRRQFSVTRLGPHGPEWYPIVLGIENDDFANRDAGCNRSATQDSHGAYANSSAARPINRPVGANTVSKPD